MQYMTKSLQLRVTDELYLKIVKESRKIGIKAAPLVRLIVEKSFRDGGYRDIEVPDSLQPSQRISSKKAVDL